VFWDGMSLQQNHMGMTRTTAEDEQFNAALHNMHLLYGHTYSMVLKLTGMPAPPQPLDGRRQYTVRTLDGAELVLAWEYGDKGWPFFESSIADSNLGIDGSRLEFGAHLQDLEACDKLGRNMLINSSEFVSASFRDNTRRPPLSPERFEVELELRTFSSPGDSAAVIEQYRASFADMSGRATTLRCPGGTYWGAAEVVELVAALRCGWPQLEVLDVSTTRIDDEGAIALGDVLAQGVAPRLRELKFDKLRSLGDRGVDAVARALPSVPRLERLALCGGNMTSAGLATLAAALPAVPGLWDLVVYCHGRGQALNAGVEALVLDALPALPRLKRLDLSGIEGSRAAKRAVEGALPAGCCFVSDFGEQEDEEERLRQRPAAPPRSTVQLRTITCSLPVEVGATTRQQLEDMLRSLPPPRHQAGSGLGAGCKLRVDAPGIGPTDFHLILGMSPGSNRIKAMSAEPNQGLGFVINWEAELVNWVEITDNTDQRGDTVLSSDGEWANMGMGELTVSRQLKAVTVLLTA
jgi:hypothetical protein